MYILWAKASLNNKSKRKEVDDFIWPDEMII